MNLKLFLSRKQEKKTLENQPFYLAYNLVFALLFYFITQFQRLFFLIQAYYLLIVSYVLSHISISNKYVIRNQGQIVRIIDQISLF